MSSGVCTRIGSYIKYTFLFLLYFSGRRSTQTTESMHSSQNIRKGFGMDSDETQVKKPLESIDLFSDLKFGRLILFLQGGQNCLTSSIERCKLKFTEKEILRDDGQKQVELYIDDELLTTGCAGNIRNARTEACNKAVSYLQEYCYTIKVNLLIFIRQC